MPTATGTSADLDLDLLRREPWMLSPIHLAVHDTQGGWEGAPHLWQINGHLTEVGRSSGGLRKLINVPYRHGKSLLSSKYFPAWHLLMNPEKSIILVSDEERFAISHGRKVQEIFKRYGPRLGLRIKADTRAKGEWMIEGHEGGMVCRGPHGGIVGRDADLFLIDDLIKNAEQALSKVTMDSHWQFYQTVVFGRIMRQTSVVVIGTRWTTRDLFGRILDQAATTGERWQHIKFKAIKEEKDPEDGTNRKVGEALWPDKVSLEHLEIARKVNPWWKAAWQQEPEEDEGKLLKPGKWPCFIDISNGRGEVFALQKDGAARKIYRRDELLVYSTVDWAYSKKTAADFSAIPTFALTPCRNLLILGVVNRRFGLHELAKDGISPVCKEHHPSFVAIESGHPSLREDCGRYPEIPQIRWVTSESKEKLRRALPAILMGEAGEIYRPEPKPPWWSAFESQLRNFNGLTDEHDDMVDALGYGCKLAQELRPRPVVASAMNGPDVLVPGREMF